MKEFLHWLYGQIKKGVVERKRSQDWLDLRWGAGFFGGIICTVWGLIFGIFIGGWTWLLLAFGIFLFAQLLHLHYIETQRKVSVKEEK